MNTEKIFISSAVCLDGSALGVMDGSALGLQAIENRQNFKYMLTQPAESRSLWSSTSSIHKMVPKTPQYYQGPFVDTLMLLFTDTKELIFTKSIHVGTFICQTRVWDPERQIDLLAVSEGEAVPRLKTYTLSAAAIERFYPWGIPLMDWKKQKGSKLGES